MKLNNLINEITVNYINSGTILKCIKDDLSFKNNGVSEGMVLTVGEVVYFCGKYFIRAKEIVSGTVFDPSYFKIIENK